MPNSCVCKAAEGTIFIFFLKENSYINIWAKTRWVQDCFNTQFCFSCFIKTALVSRNWVRYELLFWNSLVFSTFSNIFSNIRALQSNTHDFGLYSSLVFNGKCCFAWFHSTSKYLPFSSVLCLPFKPPVPIVFPPLNDLQLCGCWLLIILSVSLLKSHWLFYNLCYFILCSSGVLRPISSIYVNYL